MFLRLDVLFGSGNDGHKGFVLAAFVELDDAVAECEEGMVLTHAYILTRIVDGATLTDDDIASDAGLTTIDFDTQTFAFGFTTIAGTTDTFFMSHNIYVLKGLTKIIS